MNPVDIESEDPLSIFVKEDISVCQEKILIELAKAVLPLVRILHKITKKFFNPIPRVVWNYVNPCGGAIMARMDSSHPEAVSRHPKAQK